MYLAHNLLTLGHHFKAHLPQQHSEGVASFVDLVPGFRKLGNATLLQPLISVIISEWCGFKNVALKWFQKIWALLTLQR